MSWAHALRRPRVYGERRQEHPAFPGDLELLRKLATDPDRYTSSTVLGGWVATQAVYRLRNTYGADIIQTLTGAGYRLTKRGREIAEGVGAE